MKNKEQEKAKKQLRRNFFQEALMAGMAPHYHDQLPENIKRRIARKRLSIRKN